MSERDSKSVWEWLGFQSATEIVKNARFGRVLGGFISVVAAFFLVVTLWLIFEITSSLYAHDHEAVRNNGFILAAIFTAGFAAWRGVILSKQADIAEQGHITDRYIKAVEQLGSEKTVFREGEQQMAANIEVRIGALFTLERIAKESLPDHIAIMETICAYVRNNAGLHNKSYDRVDLAATNEKRRDAIDAGKLSDEVIGGIYEYFPPREDIQTALTILGRRNKEQRDYEAARKRGDAGDPYKLDLRGTMLAKCDLNNAELGLVRFDGANLTEAGLGGANLTRAGLYGANLTEAGLGGANLTRAGLYGANLTGAGLDEANLTEAGLDEANLTEAWLGEANLTEAGLDEANLTGARLDRANLTRAGLYGAKLKSADLSEWTCARISLRSADFTDAMNVTQESINTAFGVASGFGKTVLPEGIAAPDHWHVACEAVEDSDELYNAYSSAYEVWVATLTET